MPGVTSLASLRESKKSTGSLVPSGPVHRWRRAAQERSEGSCRGCGTLLKMFKDLFDHAGSSMLAITFTAPPQFTGLEVNLEHPLQTLRLRLIATWRAGAGSSVISALRRPRLAGVTCARSRWFGAKTPW